MTAKISAQNRENLILAINTSLFLGMVLYIYKGYNIDTGISASGHSLLSRSILFAVITGGTFYLSDFLFIGSNIKLHLWWRRLLQVWLAGSMVFLLYNYFWQWSDLYFFSYLKMLAEFAGVMIIPLAFHFLIFRKPVNSGIENEMLKISSANGKQVIKIRKQDFLLAKAEDNYVKLFYLKNGNTEQHLIRATLSYIVSQINHQDVLQCHRSFAVNRVNIVHQELKSNKLLLSIQGYPLPVPVSTKYQEQFVFE